MQTENNFLQVANVEAYAVHRGSVGVARIVFHFDTSTNPTTVKCSVEIMGNHPQAWNGEFQTSEQDAKTMAFDAAVKKIHVEIDKIDIGWSGSRFWNNAAIFASMRDQWANIDWRMMLEQSGYTLFRVL